MGHGYWDVAVVGGGIVGLATALAVTDLRPKIRVIVLDKEREIGAHQTGHNSGVIHSGIYYRPGSYKARLCLEGRRSLIEFCEQRGIPLEQCGKVIVATHERDLPGLQALYERGVANGVEGLERIGPERLREIEPYVAGIAALYLPSAAIVDFGEVAKAMGEELRKRGGALALGSGVWAIDRGREGARLHTTTGDVLARTFVNCAGLYSDAVARQAGIVPDVRIIPFRGEFYDLRPERWHLARGLIYPVPDPEFPFLGVHITRTVDGRVRAGPNAVLAFAREGYSLGRMNMGELMHTLAYRGFWAMARRYWRTGLHEFYGSLSKRAFVRSARRLVPSLTEKDLVRGGTGVRAQAVTPDGVLLDDFRIVDSPHGIHVLNAPSPAATASMAIGRHIAGLTLRSLDLGA